MFSRGSGRNQRRQHRIRQVRMTSKADLVEQIFGLCPEPDLDQLRELTRQLVDYRDNPQMEKHRFEGTRLRGITGYGGHLLPQWERVLVTGGTGCARPRACT
jgi:hypothetical protein